MKQKSNLILRLLTIPYLYFRSSCALNYAKKHDTLGTKFADFGRYLGWRMLLAQQRGAIEYILTPVSCTRFFEFQFVLSCLSQDVRKNISCLDVSSPRLFSLYSAAMFPKLNIDIINPDLEDVKITQKCIAVLHLQNVNTLFEAVDILEKSQKKYDVIWAISVIEHISGNYDDSYAMNLMYSALKKGGELIVTVPVDRTFWNEYRNTNYYGTQKQISSDAYFFQRFYDKKAVYERLLAPIGQTPKVISWFGENKRGRFKEYIQCWLDQGRFCTVEDPREITDFYQEYPNFEAMPGSGVCGFIVEKS